MSQRKRQPPQHVPNLEDVKMPLLYAVAEFIPRMGLDQFEIGFHDEDDVVLFWWAGARLGGTWEYDCAVDPQVAAVRLAERLVDGGTCQHCGRTTGLTAEWGSDMPLEAAVCWYKFDPETTTFRRSCDGNEEESPRER